MGHMDEFYVQASSILNISKYSYENIPIYENSFQTLLVPNTGYLSCISRWVVAATIPYKRDDSTLPWDVLLRSASCAHHEEAIRLMTTAFVPMKWPETKVNQR